MSDLQSRSRSRSRSGDPRASVDLPPGHEILHVHHETHGQSTADKRDDIIAQLTEKVRESSSLFASLEARLHDRDRELEHCKKDLLDCEDELERTIRENERLQRRERDASVMEEEMTYGERHMHRLEDELQEKERTVDLMKEMLDEKTSNIKLLKEHHDTELSSQGVIFNNVLDKRDDDIDELVQRVRDLEAEREDHVTRTQDMTVVHDELKQTKLDILNMFEAISLIFNFQLPQTSDQLLASLKEVKQYLADCEDDLRDLDKQHNVLSEAHKTALQDIDGLQAQAERDHAELLNADDVQGELDKAIQQSQLKLNEVVTQENRAKHELTKAIESEENEKRNLEEKIEVLKADLDEMNESYVRQSEELEQKSQEVEKRGRQLEELRDGVEANAATAAAELEEDLQQAREAVLLLCNRLYEYGLPDCGDNPLPRVLSELTVFVSHMCLEIDELKKSRNRSRRQKEEIITSVLEDQVVQDMDWDSESEPDDDDLSEHESGNVRWAITRVRVRSVVDRLREKEREVGKWRRKCEAIEKEMSVIEEESAGVSEQHMAGPYLGLVAETMRAQDDVGMGVRLVDVLSSTAAGRAGLRVGDRITFLDATQVSCAYDLEQVLASLTPGDTVDVSYLRGKHARNTVLIVDPAHEYKRRRRRMSRQEIKTRVGGSVASTSERRRRRSTYND